MRIVCLLILTWLTLPFCGAVEYDSIYYGSIIPEPNQMVIGRGTYTFKNECGVAISSDNVSIRLFEYLKDRMKNTSVFLKRVPQYDHAEISFITDSSLADEAYVLDVTSWGIKISSNASGAGFFYGIQSLLQLMPTSIYDVTHKYEGKIEIPVTHIVDAPRFSYRGAMMDVARNFLSKEEVLKFLDLMAMHKMNKLHLHLTDDQGWRIEIKKYPRLIEIGSWRKQTQVGFCDYYYPRRFDDKEQRGYYTQEDIREIVRYASDRFITVIPEIEMPGHASAALAAYPEYSCGLGKTYVVRDYFDIFDEVYCPKDTTLSFLKNVLNEVIALFPSHYIHIGGDECPKKAWKKCANCQALMRHENLQTEEALQSWFIHRIEEFINSKGRDIIGWDEILEGGLAPNATVMSWRGEKGGIEAARQKHSVIMTPGYACYYDHYQEDPEFSPWAIGGFLPLNVAYNYNPLPNELTTEEQRYIIGTQANVWGEYVQTSSHFEYMAFPRMLAMAEVQWTQPKKKDFRLFTLRLIKGFERLDYCGVNSCRNFFDVNFNGNWNKDELTYEVALNSFYPNGEIRYAINDSLVISSSSLYKTPIRINENAMIYAAVFKNGKRLGRITQKQFSVNKCTGQFTLCEPLLSCSKGNSSNGLTDGIRGYSRELCCWNIFETDCLKITIDLQTLKCISRITSSFLWRPYDRLWPARLVRVFTSEDGRTFTLKKKQRFSYDFSLTEGTRFPVAISLPKTSTRYVRLEILGGGLCPKGFYCEGESSRLAADEIEVY